MPSIKDIATGIVGVTKATLGIGYAEPELIESRLSTCFSCPKRKTLLGNEIPKIDPAQLPEGLTIAKLEEVISPSGRCGECGCFISSKVSLKDSSCPLEKW